MEVVPPTYNRMHSHIRSPTDPGQSTAYMSHPGTSPQSQFGSSSQTSSIRSSDSTSATSTSALFNVPTPTQALAGLPRPPNHDSVLNRRGDRETSLFQISLNLQRRLKGLPGFAESLAKEEAEAGEDADPVTILWRFLCRGYPLMDLYNASNPRVPLSVDPNKVGERKRGQAATFKFIHACMKDLGITECFMIIDLYGDDTTGFVKVTRVVNQVLDILVQRGVLDAAYGQDEIANGTATGARRTKRQYIIEELVATERTYVQHLELLHEFKKLVEHKGVISGDAIHDIFFNLNSLLDVQRRFLIRVEQTNVLSEDEQNWGNLFVLYKDFFKVYEQYIANQNKSERVALREFDKLREINAPPELQQFTSDSTVLSAFLLKPFQRLAKYPLLLRELRDKGDLDPVRKAEVDMGINAASSVLQATNAAVDKQLRIDAMVELNDRVEDWKGHQLQSFGELLLHGTYQVLKGDTFNPKEQEREEVNVHKQKNKVLGKQLTDKKGRARMQLKGRIFMQNVTDTVLSTKPGSYSLQIFWKGDPGVESFTIKFNQEDVMRKFADQVNIQRKICRASTRISQTQSLNHPDLNDNEFHFMQGQQLVNPYQQAEYDDDDEDEYDGSTMASYPASNVYSDYSLSGSEPHTSFRSRSTTADSGPPLANNRLPVRQLSHGLQTVALQVQTGHFPGADQSCFSPVSESPISTRSSGTQSIYGSYRPQVLPPIPGWSATDDYRFTAPAMHRQQTNSFQSSARVPQQRPSLLPTAHSTNIVHRMRSASSPDIANSMRRPDLTHAPPLPQLPSFSNTYGYSSGPLERSHSSSPAQPLDNLPIRVATQSPGLQQVRSAQSMSKANLGSGSSGEYSQYLQPSANPALLDKRHTPPEGRMALGMMPLHQIQHQALLGTPASLVPGYAPPPDFARPSLTSIPTQYSTYGQNQATPTQLKVRVHYEAAGCSMVLVVPTTISYQTLKDRIDAKLQRTTDLSLSSGQAKLTYKDEGDLVSILSDEDVQMAFETWRDHQRGVGLSGLAEVELYIQ